MFVAAGDPVASGIVPRLDRPGGNVSGFGRSEGSLGGKRLELLSEIAPGLNRAAIIFNPDTAPVSAYMPSFETAARSLKVDRIIAPFRNVAEIEMRINALGREPGGGLVVMGETSTLLHRAPIILAAARNNVTRHPQPAVRARGFDVPPPGGPESVSTFSRCQGDGLQQTSDGETTSRGTAGRRGSTGAKDRNGNPVRMVINPDPVAAVTFKGGANRRTTGQGSAKSTAGKPQAK